MSLSNLHSIIMPLSCFQPHKCRYRHVGKPLKQWDITRLKTTWNKLITHNISSLQWRHNERDDVLNHQTYDGLFTQPFIQGADQRKHQNSESLAIVRGIHRWPVNSPHKGPVTRKMFTFDDVIMHIKSALPYISHQNCIFLSSVSN